MLWARRAPKSLTTRPCAARTMRLALVAISDWWLISSKMAVSTICASISGATTVTTGVLGYITVPSRSA